MLWPFNSLSLWLFCLLWTNIYAYVSLFYAYFGYFKAFWRVIVCFRCSLSSWVKIMRQKASFWLIRDELWEETEGLLATCLRACATHHIYAPIFYSLQTCFSLLWAWLGLLWACRITGYVKLRFPKFAWIVLRRHRFFSLSLYKYKYIYLYTYV